MSFTKVVVPTILAAALVAGAAPLAYAQVGGGTELPSNAEPQNAKSGNGSMASKAGMKSGAMKKKSSMMKKKKKSM